VENDTPDTLDIEIAIRSVTNNKAPGTGNIHIKTYKKGGQLLINMLHSLIKRMCLQSAKQIVPICNKKGDKLQYHSYTGISLLCTGSKY